MSGSISNPYGDYIAKTEAQYGIPGGLLNNLLGVETGFTYSPDTFNASTGASGMAQVLPTTAANPGYGASPLTDPFNAHQSIDFAGQYLSGLYQSLGSWYQAVKSYGTTQPSVPGGGLTTAQQELSDAATAADLSGSLGMIPGAGDLGLVGASLVGPNQGKPAIGTVGPIWGDWALRIAIAFLAVMLILVGAWSLAQQQTIAATIKDARGLAL